MIGSKIDDDDDDDDEVGDPVRGLLFGLVVVMVVLQHNFCRPTADGCLWMELDGEWRSYGNVAFGKSDVKLVGIPYKKCAVERIWRKASNICKDTQDVDVDGVWVDLDLDLDDSAQVKPH